MKRLAIVAATIFAAFLLTTTVTAQAPAANIVYVNTQALLEAHPDAQAALDLEAQAQEELESIQQQLEPLVTKANSGQQLTEQERSQLNLLSRTLQETQQRYTQDYNELIAPIQEDIDAAIAAVAQENGYVMVLNRAVAAGSGLVVYALPELDITQQVIERLQAQ